MTPAATPRDGGATVDRATRLVELFCPVIQEFGAITAADPGQVSAVERQLLDHRSHMTVAMERHHACRVDVRVVALRDAAAGSPGRYAREILLLRPDGRVVQYGIVRIDLAAILPDVAAAIRRADAPLGRILVDAGLLCDVQHVQLLTIEPGPHLRGLLSVAEPLSGRVAEILVDGRPAIELLEVVAPA